MFALTPLALPHPTAPHRRTSDETPTNLRRCSLLLTGVMAFAGPAPELVNGRLAMLGFVAALGAELSTGKGVVEQLDGFAVPIAATFVLIIAGSLVPLLKNVKPEALGPLTPKVGCGCCLALPAGFWRLPPLAATVSAHSAAAADISPLSPSPSPRLRCSTARQPCSALLLSWPWRPSRAPRSFEQLLVYYIFRPAALS
jgi:hypothetical protein